MRQPDLGRKIADLRKAKGLTQEELVEMCNISVRTIQRIESGEVTPRSYTLKTILLALGADLDKIAEQEEEDVKTLSLKSFLLRDLDLSQPSGFLMKQLNIAWIFGVAYFILGIPESIVEYYRFTDGEMIVGSTLYVSIKIFVLIAYVFFMRGFVILAGLFSNYLLKVISIILIGLNTLILGYDIVSIFYAPLQRELVLFGAIITLGGIGIVYGLALFRLQKSLGTIASVAGVFEIIAALLFLTVFLSPLGLMALLPAELAEIILIFKAVELMKAKEVRSSLA
ncbi:transcriptional regulator with XRE-family HTH domain [Catalinimonas alkaloidigena]|uniref:helix-turn-helix domain-containing protein n=1 Tax=Catalinimonas alkaloidigena TaxID=1075417 RepID=UPI002404EBD2|nr:helix-turn-helix transcriptional regulator [Catalinimonas alkaloidigena]MDF9799010.1 transcriptional regulator with XRE-family HTH domain [Catalinimonas alkaloidigena]